jgi:succinoglycan biosynthesis protein ExoH
MTQDDVSARIDLLRLFMIVGLVLLHFNEFEGAHRLRLTSFAFETHPYTSLLTNFMEQFFKSSVPILSVISGYLFSTRRSTTLRFS